MLNTRAMNPEAQPITINSDYSITALVIAMVEHALLEARKGDRSARRWLYADGVLWLEGITDYHPDKIRAAFDRQLAKRTRKAKAQPGNTAQPGRGAKLERKPADPANVYA